MSEALFKTTIVIWSRYHPVNEDNQAGVDVSLEDLARDATSGEAYCSKMESELVVNPQADPNWDGTEFFQSEGE